MTTGKRNMFHPRAKWLQTWWVSCERWTVRVVTEADGNVVDAAPLLRKFVGQPFRHVEEFARRKGGCGKVQIERLK